MAALTHKYPWYPAFYSSGTAAALVHHWLRALSISFPLNHKLCRSFTSSRRVVALTTRRARLGACLRNASSRFFALMSEMGHSRHSGLPPPTSGLPRSTDIVSLDRHVSNVP